MILDLLFTDASTLVAISHEDVQELVDSFSSVSKAFCLKISVNETYP